jgi:hypothetical protein
MSNFVLSAAAAVLISISAPALAQAERPAIQNLVVTPTRGLASPSAGYLTLRGARQADRLISVSTPRARVEIHESRTENGVMRMRALKDGVVVPSGGAVTFARGGLHLMLLGAKPPLKAGERLPLTFVFERAGKVEATATVAEPAPTHAH